MTITIGIDPHKARQAWVTHFAQPNSILKVTEMPRQGSRCGRQGIEGSTPIVSNRSDQAIRRPSHHSERPTGACDRLAQYPMSWWPGAMSPLS